MDIRFSGQHLKVTEGMKKHFRQKLQKLDKYAPRIVEAHALVKKEKYFFIAEVTLLAKNFRAYGEGKSKENIFTATDLAYVRIEKQLKKFREKVKSHRRRSGDPKVSVLEEAVASLGKKRPRLIRQKKFEPKPMSTEEAHLQLQVSDEPFLVFKNSSTQKANVIFKREDGNHGLIEPEF